MTSYEKKYTADFFKRDTLSSTNHHSESQLDEESVDERSCEIEISSDSEIELVEFNSEDKQVCRLYRRVVDDVMALNKLRESTVDAAIHDMKQNLARGHKNDFRKFRGIDFSRPENCCGYMRRYAVCYTGLVKKSMWNFFMCKTFKSTTATEEIVDNNRLSVVSLGGGPGNDLIGFCSALEEIPNSIQELQLIVVDIHKGWEPVFPKLLRKAKDTDFGTFSHCLQKKIITGFMEVDLTNEEVYRDKKFSLVLGEADVLLMVKLTSFLCGEDADNLLYNVINSMKPQSKLIFIDQRYDKQFFLEIESLDCIYFDTFTYELSFNPRKSYSPSIDSAYAHVAILEKKFLSDEVSFDSQEDA